MEITKETVEYVSKLAKLSLSEDEKNKAITDLSEILGYIGTMNELDTEGIEPMSHTFPMKNVFREDVVTNSENRKAILANAPKQKEFCFMVPKTVE